MPNVTASHLPRDLCQTPSIRSQKMKTPVTFGPVKVQRVLSLSHTSEVQDTARDRAIFSTTSNDPYHMNVRKL